MFDDVINRYEVGTIINDNRSTVITTNDLETANNWFESTVNKRINSNSNKDHIIVFLYDYDQNTNINYVDNNPDLS